MTSTTPPIRGPVRPGERALAPDLARGFMLLLIVVANTPWYLWGREHAPSAIHPPDGSALDRLAQFAVITAVDSRIYPMFAFLFGYGMVQLLLRQQAAGATEHAALALLRRRNLWLLAFGFAHAALLFFGDVLGAYGLAGLVLALLFLRRRDGTLLLWAALGAGLLVVIALFSIVGAVFAAGGKAPEESFDFLAFATASAGNPDALAAVSQRLMVWPIIVLVQGLLGVVTPVAILLGFWAARRRVLEEPGRHLRLLGWTAAAGIAVGWLGGAPHALHHVGILAVPEESSFVFQGVTSVTGLVGGVGYAALFGLLGHWLRSRGAAPGFITTAVTAVGKRSLSCYLAQSVLCALILTAWGLGLGEHLHSASMLAFAVAVWLVIAAGAYALERAGRRGPAEVLLRRLAYRRTAADGGTAASG